MWKSTKKAILICTTAVQALNSRIRRLFNKAADSGNGQHYAAYVTKIEYPTDKTTIIRIALKNGKKFTYKAGQYIAVTFNGFTKKAKYSIANAPGGQEIEFHVNDSGEGGSSTYAATKLKEGEDVKLYGPFGKATYIADYKEPLLLIAGGTGAAQMKSIAEAAIQNGHAGPIYLYLGTKTWKHQYMSGELAALDKANAQFHFVPVIEYLEKDEKEAETGFVSDVVARNTGNLSDYRVYICGPSSMVEAIIPVLLEKGVKPSKVHTDSENADKLLGSIPVDNDLKNIGSRRFVP